MGLLTSYSDSNKVITSGKTVTYSKSRIFGEWYHLDSLNQDHVIYWANEYRRFCSYSYQYVGMDYDTALSCAQDMINLYNRPYYYSEWDINDNSEFGDLSGGQIPMAEVEVQKYKGCMYSVLVNVREDDTKMRVADVSPSSLFAVENARVYG